MSTNQTVEILNFVIKYFDNIQLGKKFSCKTYSIRNCAYESLIRIEDESNNAIEIWFESNYVTEVFIIEKNFFYKKTHSIIDFKTKEESSSFNSKSLESKIELISIEINNILLKIN